jgi:hypothetical protein
LQLIENEHNRLKAFLYRRTTYNKSNKILRLDVLLQSHNDGKRGRPESNLGGFQAMYDDVMIVPVMYLYDMMAVTNRVQDHFGGTYGSFKPGTSVAYVKKVEKF